MPTGCHVFPGVVDAHVHCNDPGRADWEGLDYGTRALAAGGATTFADMPLNASPPTLDGASFDLKLAAAHGRRRTSTLRSGAASCRATSTASTSSPPAGVVGFKAFMCPSGIDDFPAADDETLRGGMARAPPLGLPVAVHAESAELTARLAAEAVAAGRTVAARLPPLAAGRRRARGRSSARSRSPPRPAARCTSSTSRAGARCGSSPRRARAASTSPARPARTTSPSTRRTRWRSGWWRSARRRSAPARRSRTLWRTAPRRPRRPRRLGSLPEPAGAEGGRRTRSPRGAGSRDARRCSGCMLTEGPPTGARPRVDRGSRLGGAGAAVPASGQGIARPWCGRRSRCSSTSADEAALTSGELLSRHRLSPFVGRDLRGRVVRTIVRGFTVCLDGRYGRVYRGGRLVRPAPGPSTEARS